MIILEDITLGCCYDHSLLSKPLLPCENGRSFYIIAIQGLQLHHGLFGSRCRIETTILLNLTAAKAPTIGASKRFTILIKLHDFMNVYPPVPTVDYFFHESLS